MDAENKYVDMFDMPHHISKKHSGMSIYNRAAQFSPFAALTGHDEAINETARITQSENELDENEIALLDCKLKMLVENSSDKTQIALKYFKPDGKKSGGEYAVIRGYIRKADMFRKIIVMSDSTEIPIENIREIEFEGDIK